MSDSTATAAQDAPLSHEASVAKIAAMIREVKFAMLTTITADGHLHARPMTTQQTEFDGDVWFIADKRGEAVQDIAARPQVNVSYSSPERGDYVSINGTAHLIEDPQKLQELWSDFYKAYFPEGQSDPHIQLIKVDAGGAEFWESDGKARTLLQLAKALITRQEADLGSNESVKF